MHLTYAASIFLLAIGQSVNAGLPSEFCATKLGTKSITPVPSSTKTISIPLVVISVSTVQPIKTITPPAQTATTTVTATSTVTGTSTSTVNPPAGFTPISQENGYVPKIKGRNILQKLAERAVDERIRVISKKGAKQLVFSPKVYPTSVTCIKIVETVTTKTITISIPVTRTTTLAPSTATVTKTNTATVTAVPTTYSACSAPNFVSRANGNAVIDTFDSPNLSYLGPGFASPYDCCAICQQTPNCRGDTYSKAFGDCFLFVGPETDTCKPGVFQGDFFQTRVAPDSVEDLVFSNGPCGAVEDRGDYQDPSPP